MRIVIDMQGAQTESRFRGIGRYTLSFAQAVVRNKGEHEVFLALSGLFPETTQPIRDAFAELLPQENIRVWYAPGPVKEEEEGNDTRREVAELIREAFLASLQPDVIHITSLFEGYVDDAVSSIGRFDKNTPVSVALYDLIPLLNPKHYLEPNPRYAQYYQQKIDYVQQATTLLAISDFSRKEGLAHLSTQKAEIINVSTAIESDFKRVEIPKHEASELLKKLAIKRTFVLYTGGADQRKNLPRLIEAYALLPEKTRKTHQLLFAGKMPEGDIERFKRIAKTAGLKSDELIFTGYITDEKLVQLYNLCQLYVFPSWHEGFGLPALEAMACGAPVIGANTSSLPEVIGFEAALFDPLDVASITSKMTQALQDSEFRSALREHGLQRAKLFSWDKTAQRAIKGWDNKKYITKKFTWSEWKINYDTIYSRLIEMLAGTIIKSHNQIDHVQWLLSCAVAIDKNKKTIDDCWRPKDFPTVLKWRFEGPFDSNYSLALVNRELAKAMHDLGHDVALHSTEGGGDFKPSQKFLSENLLLSDLNNRSKELSPEDSNVCSRNLYPPRVTGMSAPYNMLHCYAWEETAFPQEWVDQYNDYLQCLTVTSTHCKKLLTDSGVSVPIEVTGNGVDHWENIKSTVDFTIDAKSFRFLHVSSCFPRKGADVMLKAYGMAFTSKDDVSLIIKTFPNPHNEIHRMLEEARSDFDDYPHVILIENDLADGQLKSLYEQCHVLLAPSRAEGFGLPMAEAMLSGLAVITTGWSGQTDFCTPETSWLIDYEFEWARTHFELFGSVWANPKVDHMAELMLELFKLPEVKRKDRAMAGRKLLLNKFKWADVAERNVDFVRRVAGKECNLENSIKVAWVSTLNTRCGIAAYSGHLINKMQSDICVYAPRSSDLTSVDSNNVSRCWDMNDQDPLENLSIAIDKQDAEVVVVQFNYGFFNLEYFSKFLENQVKAGRNVFVTLHSTIDPKSAPHKKLSILIPSFKKISRILVHSPGDLNRLKSYGLVDNVTLFPHGIVDHQASAPENVEIKGPITLASYGFFLPHKGLFELIYAVSILRKAGHDVRLIMVNSEFPTPESREAIIKAKKLISKLSLDSSIKLYTDFLSDDQSLSLLEKAQLIIFPYQNTGESSSAAVRYGIIAERDIAVTPLDIFDDVYDITYRLPGCKAEDIAQGVEQWIRYCLEFDSDIIRTRENAERWREQHQYSVVAKRLDSILKALCNYSREKPIC